MHAGFHANCPLVLLDFE